MVHWFKLNTDGASKGNPSVAGMRGIICNHLGEPLGGFLQDIGIQSNTYAEPNDT